MLPRVLFLLLLALNIGGACWIAFAPEETPAPVPASDPGVTPLVLLSELEANRGSGPAQAGAAESVSSLPASADERCVSVGPFQTQSDMRAMLGSLKPKVRRIQYRNEVATQSRGYWVYLAALKSREEALGVARNLSSRGVRDYYVVTAGEQLNTISLGLFRERANAERRKSEIAAMGFSPQLIERTEQLPVYWIDFSIASGKDLDWRALVANAAGLEERAIDCF